MMALFLSRLRPTPRLLLLPSRGLASDLAAAPSTSSSHFLTSESDASKHDHRHLGRLYPAPMELVTSDYGGLTDTQLKNVSLFPRTFTERCRKMDESRVLVRQPVIEVMEAVRAQDEAAEPRQSLRFVLWGKIGHGKSVCLGHLHHFFLSRPDFIVVNFKKLNNWFHRNWDIADSFYESDRIDHVGNSLVVLKQFAADNAGSDKLGSLKTHRCYKWTNREQTEEGEPLMSVVSVGVERPKFAADALGVLLRELRLHSSAGACRLAVLMDGVNCLFAETSLVVRDRPRWGFGPFTPAKVAQLVPMAEFTAVEQMKRLLGPEVTNTVVVTTVDKKQQINFYQGKPVLR